MIAVKSVINKIRKSGLTISFAESCSGGNIAAEVIKISGVSDIFMGGIVTYSDQAKIDILKITKQEIQKFGVVSENIAFLMAKNSKELFKTSLSLATTGNLGPLSSDNRSKVGEIYICLIFHEKVLHKKLDLKSTRVENINKLVFEAFSLIDSVL
jgi:nicotinamide-nucleotide amidase